MTETHRRRRTRRWAVPRPAVLAGGLLGVVLLALGGIIWLVGSGLPGEDVKVPAYVEQDYLTVNEWSRPGDPLEEINGVVIHYVGNPNTTAQANRNYFDSLASGTEGTYASSHFIVGLEGEVVQCVPLTEIAYASNTRNGDLFGIWS